MIRCAQHALCLLGGGSSSYHARIPVFGVISSDNADAGRAPDAYFWVKRYKIMYLKPFF